MVKQVFSYAFTVLCQFKIASNDLKYVNVLSAAQRSAARRLSPATSAHHHARCRRVASHALHCLSVARADWSRGLNMDHAQNIS